MLKDNLQDEVSEKDETVETMQEECEAESHEKIERYKKLFKLLKEDYKCPETLAKQIMRFEYNWESDGVNRSNVHIVTKLIELIMDNSTYDNGILVFVGGLSEIRNIEADIKMKLASKGVGCNNF